jgi:RNA polymerase sigma-70 factor (ECF subfamily)
MSRIEPADKSDPGPHSTATSRGLMERVQVNDPAAWRRLVDLYAPLVYRWCRRSDLPEHDAADVFQEVFQAVAAHIGGFRKEKEGDTFRGWLRTITRNKIRDHFRMAGREPPGVGGTEAQLRLADLPADPASDTTGDPGEDRAQRKLLERALGLIQSEFEPRTWQAFWLTAVDGRAAADAAAELAMTPGAVRVAKSRVLHRLREELGES